MVLMTALNWKLSLLGPYLLHLQVTVGAVADADGAFLTMDLKGVYNLTSHCNFN